MSEGLRVIGAGFGRTGTLSLKVALEQLDLGPCYHMIELLKDSSRVEHWRRAQADKDTDWDALFAGYASAVDFPVCLYYEQLMHHYPHAKFVLTVRDTESWYASASQTIMTIRPTRRQALRLMTRMPFSRRARELAKVGAHNAKMIRRLGKGEDAKRAYEAHNAQVREAMPADRLLEFSVKQGWGPLCEFLEVNEPEAPFPRVNERGAFRDLILPLFS